MKKRRMARKDDHDYPSIGPIAVKAAEKAQSSERMRQSGIIGADQLRKAIAHPLRVKILECLVGGPQSPTTLGRAIGSSVRDVTYHVRVLERKCEILEPIHDDQQDAGGQRFVRLRSPFRVANLALEQLPAQFRQGVVVTLLGNFVSLAHAAIESGAIGNRDGATLSFRPSLLDAEGWRRANHVLRSADKEIEMIEGESRERLKVAESADVVHAVFGSALFEAAPPSSKLASESTSGG